MTPRRTALVTGGSAGFGLALTRILSTEGWRVVTDARHAGALSAATADLGSRVVAVPGDLTSPAHRRRLLAAAGNLDLLVLNAGTLGPSPLPRLRELRPEDLERTLAVNVTAQAGLMVDALPQLLATSAPQLVALSSDAAIEAYEGWGAYGASKAALDHLVGVLAVEEPTLTCLSFDPGDMRTAMHQAAFPGEDISDRPAPDVAAGALFHLLGRRPASGRYRAADTVTETDTVTDTVTGAGV